MRAWTIAVVSLLVALGLVSGCVDSEPDAAQTPESAETVVNSALQTDSEGMTITAPPAGGQAGTAGGGGGGEPPADGGGGGGEVDAEAAVAIFTDTGCAACHTLSAAGSSATIGPDLDETLGGQSPEMIVESIVDPEAVIAEGFPPGVMPANYGDQLSEEELDMLAALLAQ